MSTIQIDAGTTRVTGRRVVQYILDLFLAGIVLGLVDLLLGAVFPDAGFRTGRASLTELSRLIGDPGLPSVVATLVTVAVWAVVFVVIPLRADRTPAMMLLGLRIVRTDGLRPSAGQHVGRAVLLVVDTLFAGLLGWIVILCSRNRQRIGDHAAATLVVRSDR